MRDSDWSRPILLRSDWLLPSVAICTTLVYSPPDLSPRIYKVNLSSLKNQAWFFILASVLDRGMQPINYNV